jgi:hypothetical protein
LSLLAITIVLSGPCLAQRNMNPETYYRAPSSVHGKTVILPAGTTFEGRMDGSVGSRLSHAGERFTITLASPVLANGVDVIIPAGAQVIGEIVEAIPSSKLPYNKKIEPKPNGKLRVQLNTLQTPDGVSYPLVASMAGETIKLGRRTMNNPNLGAGVGYMGTSASFEAVAPGMSDRNRGRGGRGPQVVTKQQMMRDAIYGTGNSNSMDRMASPTIRSLVKREHDLYIDSGSPITIRLDAPFKIGINPLNPGSLELPPDSSPPQPFPGDEGAAPAGGRRFAPSSPAASEVQKVPEGTAGGARPDKGQAPGPQERAAPQGSAGGAPAGEDNF